MAEMRYSNAKSEIIDLRAPLLKTAAAEICSIIRRHRLGYDQLSYCVREARKSMGQCSPRRPIRLPKNLTSVQLENFFVLVKKGGNSTHEVLFQILYATGCRVSEICNAMRDDVDIEGGKILVRQGKGAKDRIEPLSGDGDLSSVGMVGPLQCRIAESLPLLLELLPEQIVFFNRLLSEPDRVRHVCMADGFLDARNSIGGLLIHLIALTPDSAILQIGQPAFPVSDHFGPLGSEFFGALLTFTTNPSTGSVSGGGSMLYQTQENRSLSDSV